MPYSFRNLLVLVFGLLCLAVSLPLYLYISSIYRDQLVGERQLSLHSLAVATATVVAENLAERRREIAFLAQASVLRSDPLDSPRIFNGIERLRRSYPRYAWIGLADAGGTIRAATDDVLLAADASRSPWFEHGRLSDYVGYVDAEGMLARHVQSALPGNALHAVDFASPVFDEEGSLRAVLAAHVDWRWVAQVLGSVVPRNATRDGVEVFIVSQSGRILFSDQDVDDVKAPEGVFAGRSHDFVDWGGGRRYLTVAHPVVEPVGGALGWQVFVRQPDANVLAGVEVLQWAVLVIALAAAAIFLVLAWLVAAGISKPLSRLTALARRVERGDQVVEFPKHLHSRELQSLAQALGSMAQTLTEQKAALLAANHELEDKVAERTAELSRLNAELQSQARTDALTGLANRMHANERLAGEFGRYRRTGTGYALLVMDIDHFKRVNDTWGHPAGDAVLRHVAAVLRATLRTTDFIGRIGGEEFLVILPATELEQAVSVAEKLRVAVEDAPVEPVGRVTLSIGVHAPTPADADEDKALHDADQRLYAAKAGGRNRVVWQLAD